MTQSVGREDVLEIRRRIKLREHLRDFPLQVPLTELWIEDGSVDFSGEARLLNHAGYYLQ